VLKEIGADHIPQVLVWNKIDAAGLEPALERDEYDKIQRVFISAQTGAGVDLLRQTLAEYAMNNEISQAAGGEPEISRNMHFHEAE
jgi:GTP-binding protein HflX